MGFFDDMDVENTPDDPFGIPSDTYLVEVTGMEKKRNNKDTDDYVVFTYTIREGSHPTAIGQDIQEWKRVPQAGEDQSVDPEVKKKAIRDWSFIKQRLLSLGVPEDRIKSVVPAELLGVKGFAKVVSSGGYSNVREFTLQQEETVAANTGGFTL